MVAQQGDTRTWRNHAREAEGRGAVDAHGFLDDGVDVREVFDLGEGGDCVDVWEGSVEFFLELLNNVGMLQDVVEECTRCVGRGVRAGDELGEGFGSEFFTAKLVAVFVAAFHEASEEVDAVGGLLETCIDTGNGDTGKVLNGFHTLREERVWKVLCVRLYGWEASDGAESELVSRPHISLGNRGIPRDFTTSV